MNEELAVMDEKIAKSADIARRLASLLANPEPGIGSWWAAVYDLATELDASFSGLIYATSKGDAA